MVTNLNVEATAREAGIDLHALHSERVWQVHPAVLAASAAVMEAHERYASTVREANQASHECRQGLANAVAARQSHVEAVTQAQVAGKSLPDSPDVELFLEAAREADLRHQGLIGAVSQQKRAVRDALLDEAESIAATVNATAKADAESVVQAQEALDAALGTFAGSRAAESWLENVLTKLGTGQSVEHSGWSNYAKPAEPMEARAYLRTALTEVAA